jgi:hypothetical protein
MREGVTAVARAARVIGVGSPVLALRVVLAVVSLAAHPQGSAPPSALRFERP